MLSDCQSQPVELNESEKNASFHTGQVHPRPPNTLTAGPSPYLPHLPAPNLITVSSPAVHEPSRQPTNDPIMESVQPQPSPKNNTVDSGYPSAPTKAPSRTNGRGRKDGIANSPYATGTPRSLAKRSAPPLTSGNTMERYLDDQYNHWAGQGSTEGFQGPQPLPTTFQPMANPNIKQTRTLPSDLASYEQQQKARSLPSPPWRRPNVGDAQSWRDETEDGSDERSPMAKVIPFSRARSPHNIDEKRRRVVEKDGDPNIQYKNISKRRRRYISDFYTTLVDSSWIETLFLFSMSFYFTWLMFAVLYYIICYAHGDLEEAHLPANQANTSWTPCVLEIENFASCFLFSLETQHTIGYGSRQTTNECVEAMITMSLQSVIGCLIQAFMVGLVFAKLSIPKHRAKTVVFSKQAVVSERDRQLCLVFRVGDMRHDSFIVGAQLSAKIIRRRVTEEGEMHHDTVPIKILPDSCDEPCIFLIWPITVIHIIDEDSPFYRTSAADMAAEKFELHVVLEGTIESTSMTFQARTSYLPHEIYWGHRFEPMMLYRRDINKYQVNFSAFHSTYEVDTPLCSAHDLEEYYKDNAANFGRASSNVPHAVKPGVRAISMMSPSSGTLLAPKQTPPQIYRDEFDKVSRDSSTVSGGEEEATPK